jgi:hypothetical protein
VIQTLEVYRDRWNAWTRISVNRRIFSASLTVGALSLFVHVCVAVKDLVVAYHFGTADVFDAFLIAFLLPSFLISVVAGSFPSAFIPVYIEVKHQKGQQVAEQRSIVSHGIANTCSPSCVGIGIQRGAIASHSNIISDSSPLTHT